MKPIEHTITTAATVAGGRSAQVEGEGFTAMVSINRLHPEMTHVRYSGKSGVIRRIDWDAIADRLRKEMKCNG